MQELIYFQLFTFLFIFLLQHILYRQKEQFSDGVGYSWIDGLKDHTNKQVCRILTYIYILERNVIFPDSFVYNVAWLG